MLLSHAAHACPDSPDTTVPSRLSGIRRQSRAGDRRSLHQRRTRENAMSSSSPRAPIVVTHEDGLRFAAQVRSHRVIVDQPERAGGEDAGPTPLELLGVSLGTCVALYVRQFCHTRGLSYEGMRVEVDSLGAAGPHRIGELVVRVHLRAATAPAYTRRARRHELSGASHAGARREGLGRGRSRRARRVGRRAASAGSRGPPHRHATNRATTDIQR